MSELRITVLSEEIFVPRSYSTSTMDEDGYCVVSAVTPPAPPQLHPCAYCHGITHDDARGCCSACGAPREVLHG